MNPELIKRPTLVLDEAKCRRNIRQMVQKAISQDLIFRPHFKTHQSHLVGSWFRDEGIQRIAVSSLAMASYFVSDGWKNITIAFPFNYREADLLDSLAGKAKIHQTILSLEAVKYLEKKLSNPVHIWVKIDTGARRTGISWDHHEQTDPIIDFLRNKENMQFCGFLVHAGHTYNARSKEEVFSIYQDSLQKLNFLRDRYRAVFPDLTISWGDTPSCSMIDKLDGIDEIRPGNFVFYDLMQEEIGSCTHDQIAVALACPVVAKHPERNAIILYGGGVHLSKESINFKGKQMFGRIALSEGNSWGPALEDAFIVSLSQEHGIIQANQGLMERLNPGDLVYVLPVHSCMTADLMQGYMLTDGQFADHMSGKMNKSWL